MTFEDTIVAIATPFGEGAIALLRVSGRQAFALCQTAFPDCQLASLEPRRQNLARFNGSKGELIDQVLVTTFRGPASYTGEDVLEISCHGGLLVTREIHEYLIAAGCRAAGPGEFTQRAFLNGKMDLTQAEAVMDLISAQTTLALRAANEQLKGGLGDEIMGIRESLLALLAQIEAYIDFPDEDIAPETSSALQERLKEIELQIGRLLSSADEGRILREGARIVICGEPNVGKSSLLNLFLGFDRAIVHAEAGTTRDTLEEVINLEGIPLRLVDTAGLRNASDVIEKEGIDRAEREIEKADVILEVVDAHRAAADQRFTVFSPESKDRCLRILNKTDLGLHPDFAG
ncbi:MAG: tRNA uridine-5-carboxymethylaminomethyl(34) synthesis GTPase MnmE, partial [Verrucomicrobiota bacterium]